VTIPALVVVEVLGKDSKTGHPSLVALFGGWPLIAAIPFGVVALSSTS
jgi:hypothetical protein